MNWSMERWNLRVDGAGRKVYFPFGVVGQAYEVGNQAGFDWLRQQERRRRVGFFVVMALAAIMPQLTRPAPGLALALLLVAGYEAVTGWDVVRRASGLTRLAAQPNAIERAADGSGISITGGYALVLCWAVLVAILGTVMMLWDRGMVFGTLLIVIGVWVALRATVAFVRVARHVH